MPALQSRVLFGKVEYPPRKGKEIIREEQELSSAEIGFPIVWEVRAVWSVAPGFGFALPLPLPNLDGFF